MSVEDVVQRIWSMGTNASLTKIDIQHAYTEYPCTHGGQSVVSNAMKRKILYGYSTSI